MSLFNSISSRRPKRNAFNLSHEVKLTTEMGRLTPTLVQEVVPGDKFRVNSNSFVRLAPMLAPIMHRIDVHMHYFFVPNRLLWSNWENFITGGPDGTLAPSFPRFRIRGSDASEYIGVGTLADYLGIGYRYASNGSSATNMDFSALPFKAYQLIYNEYYRDQNLSDPVPIDDWDGVRSLTNLDDLMEIRYRAWEKDYFTSALPWTQRGADATLPVTVPSVPGQTQDVYLSGATNVGPQNWKNLAGGGVLPNGDATFIGGNLQSVDDNAQYGAVFDPNETLKVDFPGVPERSGGFTINELRRSIRLQEWLEKNARGGARYIEQILSHFGVTSSDARLQRPEFLGGGRQPVVISEVLQTSSTDSTTPQANMAGHGLSAGGTQRFKRTFEEHGYIIGIMSILPRTAYMNGLPRHFFKFDKFDYYFPSFAHLGEQPIYNKELLFNNADSAWNDQIFGYTPRYAEYKHMQSRVAGNFKDSLNFWHLARNFSVNTNLNDNFVIARPINRVFADVSSEQDHYWIQQVHDITAVRPMPKYGTPTI